MNKKNRLLFGVAIVVVLLGYLFFSSGTSKVYEVSEAVAARETYLFNWNKIPGNDSGRLINFLKEDYSIDWVKTEKIEKIDNGSTIRVSAEKKILLLSLSDEKNMVNLTIDDGRIDKFVAKTENGDLNIYRENFAGKPPITVNGTLINGTDKWEPENKTLTFKMTDGIASMDVIYIGDKPNMAAEAVSIQAIVTGQFNNNVFEAFRMLTKCPSKYEGENSFNPVDTPGN